MSAQSAETSDVLEVPWRVCLYTLPYQPLDAASMCGVETNDGKTYVGSMDSEALAEHVVEAHNAMLQAGSDHFVTFDEQGWFIEHSMACRLAGTLGTCAYNDAIRAIADEPDPDLMGRWRITEIDSEGLPGMEKADRTGVVEEDGSIDPDCICGEINSRNCPVHQ